MRIHKRNVVTYENTESTENKMQIFLDVDRKYSANNSYC